MTRTISLSQTSSLQKHVEDKLLVEGKITEQLIRIVEEKELEAEIEALSKRDDSTQKDVASVLVESA